MPPTICLHLKIIDTSSKFYGICPKVYQVNYTVGAICMANIMILAQAVLQIFCSQSILWVHCLSLKREIILSNVHRILWKVNQIIYTLDTICMAIVPILAQAILHIFCSQCPLWVQCLCLKRGIIQLNGHRILWKVHQVIYIM